MRWCDSGMKTENSGDECPRCPGAGTLLLRSVKKFIVSYFLQLFFVFSGIAVIVLSMYSRRTIEYFIESSDRNTKHMLKEAATRLATMVTAEELDAYRKPADMELPGYQALRQKLVAFANESEVKYAYYLRIMGDKMQFIVDNDFDEKTRVGLDTPPTKSSESPGLLSALEERKTVVTQLASYMSGWDGLCTAYAPVFNSDGEIIYLSGVDINDSEMLIMRRTGQLAMLFELLCVAMVVSSGVYGYIKFRSQNRRLKSQSATLKANVKEIRHYNENLQQMVEDKTQDILKLQNAIMQGMADIVESRDGTTSGHSERTQHYLGMLINAMKEQGVYKEEVSLWNINLVLQSALLHDIGKIAIQDSILKKPGPLTSYEFEQIKNHTVIGEEIIKKLGAHITDRSFLEYAITFASKHHEKWDGTGYPNGLKGEGIPLLGRVMAIVDAYDALVSDRPYKRAFPREQAVDIIKNGAGTHFDPILVDLFVGALYQQS